MNKVQHLETVQASDPGSLSLLEAGTILGESACQHFADLKILVNGAVESSGGEPITESIVLTTEQKEIMQTARTYAECAAERDADFAASPAGRTVDFFRNVTARLRGSHHALADKTATARN